MFFMFGSHFFPDQNAQRTIDAKLFENCCKENFCLLQNYDLLSLSFEFGESQMDFASNFAAPTIGRL